MAESLFSSGVLKELNRDVLKKIITAETEVIQIDQETLLTDSLIL